MSSSKLIYRNRLQPGFDPVGHYSDDGWQTQGNFLNLSELVFSPLLQENISDHIEELWKILKEMGIPDHLTCLLRTLYAGQEETVRTGHGTTDWFQIGKGVRQGCISSLCLFNLHAEYIM